MAASCGSGSTGGPPIAQDRLLLLAWNYPDTGVTRVEIELQQPAEAVGPVEPAPATGTVAITGILKSARHTARLMGSYNLSTNTFQIAHRTGSDSLIILGIYRPTQPLSPVIGDMTFSGPPAGNGSGYGVRDSTGRAFFYCGGYTLVTTGATHPVGLVVTDSLVIGLVQGLEVPFKALVRGDSISTSGGGLRGRMSRDRATISGDLTISGAAGQWSGRRCDARG